MIQQCLSLDDLLVRRALMRVFIMLQEPFPSSVSPNSFTAREIMSRPVTDDPSEGCCIALFSWPLSCVVRLWSLSFRTVSAPVKAAGGASLQRVAHNQRMHPLQHQLESYCRSWYYHNLKSTKSPRKKMSNFSQIGLCGFQMNVCADSKHRQRWREQKCV